MTKSERIQLIKAYCKEIDQIEGAVPCIKWKHLWEPNVYLYSREDDSTSLHEIVIVKSPANKVDKALKFANKHYYQTASELETILKTLSEKTASIGNSTVTAEKPVARTAAAVPPSASRAPSPSVNANLASAQQYHIPEGFRTQPRYTIQPPSRKSGSMVSPLLVVIVLLGLLLAAYYTNPSEEKHRQAVQEMLNGSATLPDGLAEASFPGEEDVAGVAVSQISDNRPVSQNFPVNIQRKNYHLFSLTELTSAGQSEVVGLGLFGKVWLTDGPDDSVPVGDDEENSVQSGFAALEEEGADQPAVRQARGPSLSADALRTEMKRAIIVAVMEKFFDPKSGQESLTYKFVFHNRSNRNVKSFNGVVRFTDQSSREVVSLDLTYDTPLGIGERAVYHLNTDYDASDEVDVQMRRERLDNMVVDWVPQEIYFNDGTKLSL